MHSALLAVQRVAVKIHKLLHYWQQQRGASLDDLWPDISTLHLSERIGMQKQVNNDPSKIERQNTHSRTNNKKHNPQEQICQPDKSHSDIEAPQRGLQYTFMTLYAVAFMTLLISILLTQNYILLPVIKLMAEGFVVALYEVIGVRLPRTVKKLLDRNNQEDDKE